MLRQESYFSDCFPRSTPPESEEDRLILPDIGFRESHYAEALSKGRDFLETFRQETFHQGGGLFARESCGSFERGRFFEKLNSRAHMKRRPENPSAHGAFLEKQATLQKPLLFRVGFGPAKNVNLGGAGRVDDAEYLTLIQLARFFFSIATVYPYGIRAEIIPDDERGAKANHTPEERTQGYIYSLQEAVARMGFAPWVTVHEGQRDVYARYRVHDFFAQAEEELINLQKKNGEKFSCLWTKAKINAANNIPAAKTTLEKNIERAAWEYLVAARAEVLSGLWSPHEAFPLRFAQHEEHFQLYTLGYKKTKLPWQITLEKRFFLG